MSQKDSSEIIYIVSAGKGLEAFIYRELEYLESSKVNFHLCLTKYKKGDIYSPKHKWKYSFISLKLLLRNSFKMIFKILKNINLLKLSIKHHVSVDFLVAVYFSVLIKRDKVRLIHCHFGDRKFFVGFFLKKIINKPLTVTLHAHEFFTNPNKRFFKLALGSSDKIFTIADKWRKLLIDEYGVIKSKITVNRLFVDCEKYKYKNTLDILAVGRFTERKGFQFLIEAVSRCRELNIRVMFIGFGDYDLDSIVKKHDVSDRVIIYPKMNQDQLLYFYQTSDLLCLPSITTQEEGAEGIPVVLMEAMACGLPVIATDCGAIDEIIDKPDLIQEKSIDQLEEKIRLYYDRFIDGKIKENTNRETILRLYSKDNAAHLVRFFNEYS